MKTTILNLIFILVLVQFTFSQIQVSCDNINTIIGTNNTISFLNINDCNRDIVISIDESSNEDINLEGELIRNRASIRILGNENHSISLVPFDKDSNLKKKVVAHKGKLPEERKTRVLSHKNEGKGDAKEEGEITVYPNPINSNNDEITISAPKTQLTILSYTLRNNYGAIILQEYFPESNTIDVSNLNNGMYYIKIQTLQQTVTKTFIKN